MTRPPAPHDDLALADHHDAAALTAALRRHGPVLVDREAEPMCNFVGCYENALSFPCDDHLAALVVARAYLGESA